MAALLGCLSALGIVGCSTTNDGFPTGGPYMVKVPQTPFYRYGPAQSSGADLMLREGIRVTMLQREFGFSRVMTQDGQSGYVPTEDLVPAPPAPSPTPTPKAKSRSSQRSRDADFPDLPPMPSSRQLDPEPLGLPELPQQDPQPPFRY